MLQMDVLSRNARKPATSPMKAASKNNGISLDVALGFHPLGVCVVFMSYITNRHILIKHTGSK